MQVPLFLKKLPPRSWAGAQPQEQGDHPEAGLRQGPAPGDLMWAATGTVRASVCISKNVEDGTHLTGGVGIQCGT